MIHRASPCAEILGPSKATLSDAHSLTAMPYKGAIVTGQSDLEDFVRSFKDIGLTPIRSKTPKSVSSDVVPEF